MRELLFRGKTKRGKWITGRSIADYGDRIEISGCEVDPDTVGQFTGAYDTLNNKIFEGDIARTYYGKFVVKFGDCTPEVWLDWLGILPRPIKNKINITTKITTFYTERNSDKKQVFLTEPTSEKVIGNIHDNPELLLNIPIAEKVRRIITSRDPRHKSARAAAGTILAGGE